MGYDTIALKDKVQTYNLFVLDVFDEFCPLRLISPPHNLSCMKSWFNRGIEVAISERDCLVSFFRRFPTDQIRLKFTRGQRRITQMFKSAKRKFFDKIICLGVGSRCFWNGLRDLGVVHSHESPLEFRADDFGTYLAADMPRKCRYG